MSSVEIITNSQEAFLKTKELLSSGFAYYYTNYQSPRVAFFRHPGDPTEESTRILESLKKWLPDYLIEEHSELNQGYLRDYYIELPFSATDKIPPLPGKKETKDEYHTDSSGFSTNPNNWDKGLNLI